MKHERRHLSTLTAPRHRRRYPGVCELLVCRELAAGVHSGPPGLGNALWGFWARGAGRGRRGPLARTGVWLRLGPARLSWRRVFLWHVLAAAHRQRLRSAALR